MLTEEEKQKRREEYKEKNKKTERKLVFILGFFIVALIAGPYILPFIWGPVGVNILYSDGERVGMVIKLSQKGLIWKTWEGEMVLSQQGFAVTYVWPFSVDDQYPNKQVIISQLQQALDEGKLIKIQYEERAGYVPWRSKTSYFIKSIEFLR
ncbi:MAG: hypothetical protein HY832_01010 [Candidatus Aenigmarchaeota archaeon]|nr:hypothetical protein [Candidatus Aenigmarchaeota archaeon]